MQVLEIKLSLILNELLRFNKCALQKKNLEHLVVVIALLRQPNIDLCVFYSYAFARKGSHVFSVKAIVGSLCMFVHEGS